MHVIVNSLLVTLVTRERAVECTLVHFLRNRTSYAVNIAWYLVGLTVRDVAAKIASLQDYEGMGATVEFSVRLPRISATRRCLFHPWYSVCFRWIVRGATGNSLNRTNEHFFVVVALGRLWNVLETR